MMRIRNRVKVSTEKTSGRRQTTAARLATRTETSGDGSRVETVDRPHRRFGGPRRPFWWCPRDYRGLWKTGLYEWRLAADGSEGGNRRPLAMSARETDGTCSRRKQIRDTVTLWRDATERGVTSSNNNIRTEYCRTTTLNGTRRSCARAVITRLYAALHGRLLITKRRTKTNAHGCPPLPSAAFCGAPSGFKNRSPMANDIFVASGVVFPSNVFFFLYSPSVIFFSPSLPGVASSHAASSRVEFRYFWAKRIFYEKKKTIRFLVHPAPTAIVPRTRIPSRDVRSSGHTRQQHRYNIIYTYNHLRTGCC